jgi:hypothetical protein
LNFDPQAHVHDVHSVDGPVDGVHGHVDELCSNSKVSENVVVNCVVAEKSGLAAQQDEMTYRVIQRGAEDANKRPESNKARGY